MRTQSDNTAEFYTVSGGFEKDFTKLKMKLEV